MPSRKNIPAVYVGPVIHPPTIKKNKMHTDTHIWVHTHICAFLTYILTIYNNYVNNNYLKLWITMTKI